MLHLNDRIVASDITIQHLCIGCGAVLTVLYRVLNYR